MDADWVASIGHSLPGVFYCPSHHTITVSLCSTTCQTTLRAHPLATSNVLQTLQTHQPFDRVARRHDTLTVQLTPRFVRPIHAMVLLLDALNLRPQVIVTPGTTAAP